MERYAPSGQSKYKIFTLDNYSAHLDPRIEKALYEKGYILVLMDVEIIGDMQLNDIALHRKPKIEYRENEQQKLLAKLTKDPEKVGMTSHNVSQTRLSLWTLSMS